MAKATPRLQVRPSESISVTGGNRLELAQEYRDPIEKANTPGGFVQLNEDGEIDYNSWSIPVDLPATVNATIPALGSLLMKGRTLIVGDGTDEEGTNGGLPCNLNAEGCLFIAATGDAAYNDALFRAALSLVSDLEPFGEAPSATNMRQLILGPGTYDLTAGSLGHAIVPNYVDIVALIPGTVRILANSSNTLTLRQTDKDVECVSGLSGLDFVGSSSVLRFDFAANADTTSPGFFINHRKLRFFMSNDGVDTMALVANNQATIGGKRDPKISGYVTDCMSTGRRFYGGHGTTASSTAFTYDIRFERCRAAGIRSFGSSNTIPSVSLSGILGGDYAALIDCEMGGSTSEAWSSVVNCEMTRCKWNGAIQRLDTNARISFSTIRGVASGHSITNNSAVSIRAHHLLIAGDFNTTNVTNLLGSLSDAQITQNSSA